MVATDTETPASDSESNPEDAGLSQRRSTARRPAASPSMHRTTRLLLEYLLIDWSIDRIHRSQSERAARYRITEIGEIHASLNAGFNKTRRADRNLLQGKKAHSGSQAQPIRPSRVDMKT